MSFELTGGDNHFEIVSTRVLWNGSAPMVRVALPPIFEQQLNAQVSRACALRFGRPRQDLAVAQYFGTGVVIEAASSMVSAFPVETSYSTSVFS